MVMCVIRDMYQVVMDTVANGTTEVCNGRWIVGRRTRGRSSGVVGRARLNGCCDVEFFGCDIFSIQDD